MAGQITPAKASDMWDNFGSFYVQLHVGDPGTDGTANPAAETTRQFFNLGVWDGTDTMRPLFDLVWSDITGNEKPNWVSFWDSATGGDFMGKATLTLSPDTAYADGDTLTLTAAAFALRLSPIVS